jgi:translation initiation factor 2B subunit (eIF-2B alpha/beta/delta family)
LENTTFKHDLRQIKKRSLTFSFLPALRQRKERIKLKDYAARKQQGINEGNWENKKKETFFKTSNCSAFLTKTLRTKEKKGVCFFVCVLDGTSAS